MSGADEEMDRTEGSASPGHRVTVLRLKDGRELSREESGVGNI